MFKSCVAQYCSTYLSLAKKQKKGKMWGQKRPKMKANIVQKQQQQNPKLQSASN